MFADASILDQLGQGVDRVRDASPTGLDRVAALFELASEAVLEARRESADLWYRLNRP